MSHLPIEQFTELVQQLSAMTMKQIEQVDSLEMYFYIMERHYAQLAKSAADFKEIWQES